MDDNYIVNRIIDILENNNQNLLLGNISNPRPGSICQVNTDYGIKEAYNINCTYPGNAIVVWDNDEKQYYCFTHKPSEIINNRQLSYRKYKDIKKAVNNKGSYILIAGSGIYSSSEMVGYKYSREITTYTFLYNAFKRLNPNLKTLYIGQENLNKGEFFGYNALSFSYDTFVSYLENQGIIVKFVTDDKLDQVNDILCLPPLLTTSTKPTFELTKSQLNFIEKIASLYGVILQSGHGYIGGNNGLLDGSILTQFYLDKFYNKYNSPKLLNNDLDPGYLYPLLYSNLGSMKDTLLNCTYAQIIKGNLKANNILAYFMKTDGINEIPIDNTKSPNIIYWQNK